MGDETGFVAPKKCVTAIKSNPPSRCACLLEKRSQLAEKWTMRSL
jgi:hypothetical protein